MSSSTYALPSVSSRAFWSQPASERSASFAELRRKAPISFQEPSDVGLVPQRRGFWAVTRHADVQHVSRSPELFCSGEGVGLGDVPIELLELNASFLVMDAPRHTKLRRIVSGAFTPRRVAQLKDDITTGSDWPHAEGTRQPAEFLTESLAGLPDNDVRRIARDNALEVLGISLG